MSKTSEISKLPRQELNKRLSQIVLTGNIDASVILAAQYRIIDLEYQMETMQSALDFFREEWEKAHKPSQFDDGIVIDVEFVCVRD